ncbi:MAG: class I adenylate-forming enzyme family protein [Actinomycetota bacterium]
MNERLSPEPILSAFDGFMGSIADLETSVVVGPAELKGVSARLVTRLGRLGVGAGDRVALAVSNGPAFFAALNAVLALGGSPLLLHADTPPAELRRTATRFGARFAVANTLEEAELHEAGFTTAAFSLSVWAGGILASLPEDAARGDFGLDGVPLHPTSGTTGEPKLAVRPGAAAVAEAEHYIETLGIEADDLVLCSIPMSHAYGYGMCVMVPLLSGATIATMPRFNAATAIRALREQPVSVYPAVPAVLDLLMFEGGDSLPVPRRCVTSAGAPLPKRTAENVRRRWGLTVRPLYGTTETGGIAVARADHDPADVINVGPAMHGVATAIRSDEDGVVGEGGVGRLWIRSGSMMSGYLGPGGLDTSRLQDEWFDTGDLAHQDEQGNINLHGRASEIINVFGNKVLPIEVEEVIAQLPEIVEVKVYPAPNRWGSHSVKAAIVVSNGLGEVEVKAHCRKHLIAYKRPEKIAILDKLPRSPAGKIVASQLP